MAKTRRLNTSGIQLTDEEYKDLFSGLDADIIKCPFEQSETLFKKHFHGFRIQNVSLSKIQNATKKELRKSNSRLTNILFNAYLDKKMNTESLSLSPLLRKLFSENSELPQTLLEEAERYRDEIVEKVAVCGKKEKDIQESTERKVHLIEEKISRLKIEKNTISVKYRTDRENSEKGIEKLTEHKQAQLEIIERAQRIISDVESKLNDLEKADKSNKIKWEEKEEALQKRIDYFVSEIAQRNAEIEKEKQDVQKEIKVLEESVSSKEEKLEDLRKIRIEVENQELDRDEPIGASEEKAFLIDLVGSSKIELSGYYNWGKFSQTLEKLNSPLQKFKFRQPFELTGALNRGEEINAVTIEAFTGWKVSEREKEYSIALEYFSRFIFFQGYELLMSASYINARLFLMASVKTNHNLIGKTEQSQQTRDQSLALYLYSYLLEQKFEKVDNYAKLLEPSFGSYSFRSTLESLVAHNMVQQLIDTIEELCPTSVEYTSQIFADYLLSDQHLFVKSYYLLVTRLRPDNVALSSFTLKLLKISSKSLRSQKLLDMIDKSLEIGNISEKIHVEIDKIPEEDSDFRERIRVFTDSLSTIKKYSELSDIKKDEQVNILLRNLTTTLPLADKTRLVIEVNNTSGQLLQNCILTVRSRDNQVRVQDTRTSINSLAPKTSVDLEFNITQDVSFYRSRENKRVLFVVSLTREKDGKQEQLALIDNSEIFFRYGTTEPMSRFTDGSPTQLDRNMIFGRDKDFEKIESALRGQERDNTLMIFGERGIGKTTLWKVLTKDYFHRHYDVIDIDCSGYTSEKRIYRILTRHVCDKLNINPEILLKYDWKDEIIEDLIELFDEISQKHVPGMKREKKVLLILDEFNLMTDRYLTGEWNRSFLGFLRQVMSRHSDWISVILCGTPSYREVMKNYNDPLYREGYALLLQRLNKKDIEELIKQNATNVEFHSKAIEAIINSAGTNPGYVHKFCLRLMELLKENSRGKDGKILCIRNDVLKNEEVCIEEDFLPFQTLLLMGEKNNMQDIEEIEALAALAKVSEGTDDYVGLETVKALYRKHELQSPDSLIPDLATLNQKELIEAVNIDNETKYRITPKMLKLWVIKNKPFQTIAAKRATKEAEAAEIIGDDKLSSHSKSILKLLFLKKEWLSIEPKRLISGLSNAEAFIIETQTRSKDQGRPFFVKIGQYGLIEQELSNHKFVEQLDIKIPGLKSQSATSPNNAPCDCPKNCPGNSCPTKYLGAVFEFAKTSPGGQLKELGKCLRTLDYHSDNLKEDIRKLFKVALGKFYCKLELKSKQLNSLGYRSLTQSGINEVNNQCGFILQDDICVPSFSADRLICENPIKFLKNLFREKSNKKGDVILGWTHQDLHLRNTLKDSDGMLWIVDWMHFTTEGHTVKDFTGIVADVVVSLDYTENEAVQLAEILEMSVSRESEIGVSTSPSTNVSKVLTVLNETQAIYQDRVTKCGVSVNPERITGEYFFSLFLSLLSTACKPDRSKLGKELGVFYAGLLIDKVSKYINMTF